jgi:Ca2+-binding RTX toxin-like protein
MYQGIDIGISRPDLPNFDSITALLGHALLNNGDIAEHASGNYKNSIVSLTSSLGWSTFITEPDSYIISINIDGGSYTYNGSSYNDFYIGGSYADNLNGGNSNDILDGGNGSDILNGGEGDDELIGGFSDDRLDGGNGGGDWAVFEYSRKHYHVTTVNDVTTVIATSGDDTDTITNVERFKFGSEVFDKSNVNDVDYFNQNSSSTRYGTTVTTPHHHRYKLHR